MKGVDGLAEVIKRLAGHNKSAQEYHAQRGIINNGKIRIGAVSYPYKAAVDCCTDEGSVVWVLLTKSGTAVIVGA